MATSVSKVNKKPSGYVFNPHFWAVLFYFSVNLLQIQPDFPCKYGFDL